MYLAQKQRRCALLGLRFGSRDGKKLRCGDVVFFVLIPLEDVIAAFKDPEVKRKWKAFGAGLWKVCWVGFLIVWVIMALIELRKLLGG